MGNEIERSWYISEPDIESLLAVNGLFEKVNLQAYFISQYYIKPSLLKQLNVRLSDYCRRTKVDGVHIDDIQLTDDTEIRFRLTKKIKKLEDCIRIEDFNDLDYEPSMHFVTFKTGFGLERKELEYPIVSKIDGYLGRKIKESIDLDETTKKLKAIQKVRFSFNGPSTQYPLKPPLVEVNQFFTPCKFWTVEIEFDAVEQAQNYQKELKILFEDELLCNYHEITEFKKLKNKNIFFHPEEIPGVVEELNQILDSQKREEEVF